MMMMIIITQCSLGVVAVTAMWGFHDRQLTVRSLLHNNMVGGTLTDALKRRWRHQLNITNQQVNIINK